jgi:heme/copper-type cytochrome/quinol oxidase subunit 3
MEKNKLAMLLFIANEAVFFLLLILAYVAFHRQAGTGPTAASSLDLGTTGFFTVCLLSSSFTMWRAEVNQRRGQRSGVRWWLAATIVLGATFLLGQGREYAGLIQRNVTISRDLFGTTFFTLTGFHGLHVLLGLIMLVVLFGLATFGAAGEPRHGAVNAISVYWHFVDAVWVVIFSIVYLWAFL